MANHGYVKTKKFLSPAKINALLEELNRDVFKGCLKFEYEDCRGQDNAWGDDVWIVTYDGDAEQNEKYVKVWTNYWKKGNFVRVFWLNTRRTLEIRHGGGGDFCWWVDAVIRHEVAHKFNGVIEDDAGDWRENPQPDRYRNIADYLDARSEWFKGDTEESHNLRRAAVKHMMLEMSPPEFWEEIEKFEAPEIEFPSRIE